MVWPEDFSYSDMDYSPMSKRLPFVPRIDAMPLRCIVDPDLPQGTPEAIYLQLIQQVGPEATGIELVPLTLDLAEEADGIWRPNADDPAGWHTFSMTTDSRTHHAGGNAHIEEQINRLAERDGLSYEHARAIHLPLAGAMQIPNIHIYITATTPLFGTGRLSELFVCGPAEAMAFLGLYQRLRGTMWTLQRGWPAGESPQWTAHLLTPALMPELRAALARYDSAEFPKMAWSLLGSAKVRLERVLVERDYMIARHLVAGRRLPYASAEEILEHMVMNLSGLFDAVARAINIGLSMGLRSRECAFHRTDFRAKLPYRLRAIVDDSRFLALLNAIKILRNTIHHEALGAGSASDQQRKNAPLAMVSAADARDLAEAATTLGTASRWLLQLHPTVQVDEFGLGVYALPAAEDLLAFTIEYGRAILRAVEWPGHATGRAPGYWETPALLEQLAGLYGLSHLRG